MLLFIKLALCFFNFLLWHNCLHYFILSAIVMATHGTTSPRVLVLGHSFIRRLQDCNNPRDLDLAFKIKEPGAIIWRGFWKRTVAKTIRHNLHVVHSVRPGIVIVQLGTNNLSFCPPLLVGSDLEDFVCLLHDSYGLQIVCVCQDYSSSSFRLTFG